MHSKQPAPWPAETAVVRRIVLSQILFTAGHVLTTGGFLYYYADAFGPTAFQFSVLLILPELAETAGLCGRTLVRWTGSRKRTWIAGLVAARLLSLGVPLMAVPVLRGGTPWPFWVMVAWVAGWSVLQGIAYVCFVSWISELVDERRWGWLFARREMARLGVTLIVPVAAGYVRRHWASQLPADQQLVTYAAIFGLGTVLVLGAIIPMLGMPNVTGRLLTSESRPGGLSTSAVLGQALRDRAFCWLLLHGWWLSFAQGLTQAATYQFQIRVLNVSLETYTILTTVMLLLQLPAAWWAGRQCDRDQDLATLLWSVTLVSGALLFWLLATPDRWWLLSGGFVVWGLFGFVNVSQRSLSLKLAPRSDNVAHLSLFRQVGGLFAAVAGLLGGLWLDDLLARERQFNIAGWSLGPYQIVFLTSFLGRLTAGLWLIPIRRTRG
jgi:hypothetical protein